MLTILTAPFVFTGPQKEKSAGNQADPDLASQGAVGKTHPIDGNCDGRKDWPCTV
jgi:hypothetical protein